MNRLIVALATGLALCACGDGNPFDEADPEDPDTGTTSEIPADIAGDVDSITYDAANQTLIVRGQSIDDTPYAATYTRKPGLDRGGYEAYTAQEGSLGRHHTAYVKEIDGAQAFVVMAGGQFNEVFSGATYSRSGSYSAPDVSQPGGIVHYAGNYVGLVNGPGDGGDLNPVAAGTDPAVLPRQAAEVTGDVFITADFADNVTDGVIYNRAIPDYADGDLKDVTLSNTAINSDGTFTGSATIDSTTEVGTYGGNFAGQGATAVAGAVFLSDHIDGVDNEIEQGIFVLGQCGTANDAAVCDQPLP
ncbi:MAG: thymidylate synthase [Rhodobacteraceae bacterium]|nr:thymidylate synthase [Paracoccaceae bacterium]MAY47745.1 thymidylate synthase [Paracoccaceae bacterium]